MEQILRPKALVAAEQVLIVLALSLLGAIAANYAVGFVAGQFGVVGSPYDPSGLLVGTLSMTVAAMIALLTRRPGIVMAGTVVLLLGFFVWTGQDWKVILMLSPFAFLLPGISIFAAWFSLKSLRR